MSKIMNEENVWDKIADADIVERRIERVTREEIMEVLKYSSIRKVPGPTEVYAEIILASGDVVIGVLMELSIEYLMEKECQKTGLTVL